MIELYYTQSNLSICPIKNINLLTRPYMRLIHHIAGFPDDVELPYASLPHLNGAGRKESVCVPQEKKEPDFSYLN